MKSEYTKAELLGEITALGQMFDTVYLIDPANLCLLNPETMQPGKTWRVLPALDKDGRGWQPVHIGDHFSFAFYQAITVDGRGCILLAAYTLPGADDGTRDAVAFRRLMNQYDEELHQDYVTGVYNRRYLDEEYVPKLLDRIAEGTRVSVALACVEDFSGILNRDGRDAADRCLTVAAGILQIAAGLDRQKGILARLDDGNFLITAADTSRADLEKRLKSAIAGSRRVFSSTLSRRGEFGISVGTAEWTETGSWDLLLALAAQRLPGGGR
jgi:GGDEF domain-containing protein